MSLKKALVVLLSVWLVAVGASAEEAKPKEGQASPGAAPDPNAKPSDAQVGQTVRAKMTEEQAVLQLKYMMVNAWAYIEQPLVKEGKFNPLGMVVYPDGTFKPMYLAEQDSVDPALQLGLIAKQLEVVAQTRAVFGVGLMYAQKTKMKDGTDLNLIMVNTEHIAGWGRHWAYPYTIENGELLLGQPKETPTPAFYFVPPERRKKKEVK
jgi:hypothetical protein